MGNFPVEGANVLLDQELPRTILFVLGNLKLAERRCLSVDWFNKERLLVFPRVSPVRLKEVMTALVEQGSVICKNGNCIMTDAGEDIMNKIQRVFPAIQLPSRPIYEISANS